MYKTTLEDFKNQVREWYEERPQIIKDAIEVLPPICMYKIKATGSQCYIVAYSEPEEGTEQILENVTVRVQKTGKGGPMFDMGLGELDTNGVFGLHLTDLEPWEDEHKLQE